MRTMLYMNITYTLRLYIVFRVKKKPSVLALFPFRFFFLCSHTLEIEIVRARAYTTQKKTDERTNTHVKYNAHAQPIMIRTDTTCIHLYLVLPISLSCSFILFSAACWSCAHTNTQLLERHTIIILLLSFCASPTTPFNAIASKIYLFCLSI